MQDGSGFGRIAITMVVSILAGAALPTTAQQRPCQEDLKKLCPDVRPGSREARTCLQDNLDKLSDGCRQRVSQARGRQRGYPARFRGCEGDLDKFCKGVMQGGGRLVTCLREHEGELSSDCKGRLPGSRAGGGGSGQGRGGGGGQGKGSGGGHGSGSASGGGGGGQQTGQTKVTPQSK